MQYLQQNSYLNYNPLEKKKYSSVYFRQTRS